MAEAACLASASRPARSGRSALIAQATGLVRRLEEQQLERTRVEEVVTRLTGETRRSAEALATEETRSELRLRALTDALIGCGLHASSDDVAVAAALDGFDQWASGLGAHEQMQERVRLIQADIDDVEAEVAELLGRLGRAGGLSLGRPSSAAFAGRCRFCWSLAEELDRE